jgi:hypothetical protein
MQVRMAYPTGGDLDDLTLALWQSGFRKIILNDKSLSDPGENDRTHKTETDILITGDQRSS